VFQLQAPVLSSAASAVNRLAAFALQRTRWQPHGHTGHEVQGDPIARAMVL